MKLFGHPESGHAFKVKFLLDFAGIEHEYEVIDIFAPNSERSQEFQKISRYQEVPVLVDETQIVVQSNAILVHLAQRHGLWGAEDSILFNRCLEWLFWEANKIGLCLPQLRAAEKFPEFAVDANVRSWLLDRFNHDVGVLENELADGRPFMVGEQITIADFSLCGYLFFSEEANVEVPLRVQEWLIRLSSLTGWRHPYQLLSAQLK